MSRMAVLMEDKTCKQGFACEPGLSLLIETDKMNILMDCGATDAFISNCEKMGIDLGIVDCLVISHGHYDHTGGVPHFSKVNKTASIYVHKNAFQEFYCLDKDGKREGSNVGIPWTIEERKAMEDRLIFTEGPRHLADNIILSGTIPKSKHAKTAATEMFYIPEGDGYREDPMDHEQFIVIEEKDGLYVFSGCSHCGVESILDYAEEMLPGRPIAAFIGGIHLKSTDGETQGEVIGNLMERGVKCVIPMHCTGMGAILELRQQMGENCILANAGDILSFRGIS